MRNEYKKVLSVLCPILLILVISFSSFAQEDENDDIYEMDLEALMNMEIVSASKQSESLFDAPVAASVVTGDEIKKSGCTSVMEALRLIPGVIVREVTPGNYDIHLRGYDAIDPNAMITLTSNTITLVMINSRPIYNEFQGQTNWELQQVGIDDIERIEVVRGPASAMYGPNAVAGVINLITKNPDKKEGLNLSTYSQAGTHNTILGNASIGYNLGNGLSLRGGFNYDVRDRHNVDYFVLSQNSFVDELDNTIVSELGYQPKNPDLNPYTSPPNIDERFPDPKLATDRYSTNLHTRYSKNKDLEINLMAGLSEAKVQRVWARNQITALSNDHLNNTFAHLWGKAKGLTYSVDYTMGEQEILGSGKILTSEYNWSYSNFEYDLHLGDRIKFKPGVSYRTTSFDMYSLGSTSLNTTTYEFEEAEGDITNSMMSGHLQGEYKTNRFRFIGAIRADKFKYPDKTIINPLLAATYKASDDFLVRGSYGKSARTPFMMDLFFKVDLLYPNIGQFNPALDFVAAHYRGTERADDIPGSDKRDYKPLEIEDLQLGIRHKISETFQLDVELFWSKLSNLVTTANLNVSQDVNLITGTDSLGNTIPLDTIVTGHSWNSFVNIDAEPTQTGVTIALKSVPFSNLTFQVFATMQQTVVKKYYEALDQNGNAIDIDGDGDKYIDDYYHTATPAFYGGVISNYKPIPKLNVNLNAYIMSHQNLRFGEDYEEQAKANILLNSTITYEIMKGISVFANGRNLFNNKYRQFAFADKIGATYLFGARVNL